MKTNQPEDPRQIILDAQQDQLDAEKAMQQAQHSAMRAQPLLAGHPPISPQPTVSRMMSR